MNIKIDKNTVFQPVAKLVNIAEKRSLMPILSNILISITSEQIVVSSTDLELSGVAYIKEERDIQSPIKLVVHGKRFVDILRELENGEVDLGIKDNILTIKQGQTEFVLTLQDPDEFPEIKTLSNEKQFSLEGNKFVRLINKVSFAVSNDESRFVLMGMFMEGKKGEIRVVGTDGFRMALYKEPTEGIGDFKGVVIPRRSLGEVERMFDGEQNIDVYLDEKYVQFKNDKMVLISRIIEGSFPDYENVMPSNNNIVEVDREAFLKGLKKVSAILGRSEPVKVVFGKDRIEINSESDLGTAREILDARNEGEEVSMNFNVKFLMDVVQHLDSSPLLLKIPSGYGAVLLEENGNDKYKNIIMPIRV